MPSCAHIFLIVANAFLQLVFSRWHSSRSKHCIWFLCLLILNLEWFPFYFMPFISKGTWGLVHFPDSGWCSLWPMDGVGLRPSVEQDHCKEVLTGGAWPLWALGMFWILLWADPLQPSFSQHSAAIKECLPDSCYNAVVTKGWFSPSTRPSSFITWNPNRGTWLFWKCGSCRTIF